MRERQRQTERDIERERQGERKHKLTKYRHRFEKCSKLTKVRNVKLLKYSGDLNSELVWYLNGPK